MSGSAVVIVSNHAEIVGGGEISLLGLLEGLRDERWTPIPVVPGEGAVAVRCRALGLEPHVVPLPGLRAPRLAGFRSVIALGRLMRATAARVVHANGSRAMAYAGAAGRLARRPVIWHVRVADRDAVLDRVLAALAAMVVVNSRAVAARFRWARSCKVRCIPNGVDLARFSPRPPAPGLRAALGLPDSARVVASIGRFVEYKGYDDLLEAARLVHDQVPETHWLLVGDGPLRAELEARCRQLGLAETIHLLGWRDDVAELLALCEVLVLPSHGEHFGRVLIEAMAAGKPTVATAAGGVPEVVVDGETGLLVAPGDAGALARATGDLLLDAAWGRRLGQAGRRRAESRFGVAAHIAAVEAVYDELAEVGRGAV